jgi:chemotaxis protein CheD
MGKSMNNTMILGVGDLGASAQSGAIIKTYALGSCVALMILDRKTRCVGMAHVVLPDSETSPEKAKKLLGYFADTAIPELLNAMRKAAGGILSAQCDLIVKMCGGANVVDKEGTFNIGKRNALAIKKHLWKYGLAPRSDDTGGNFSRTVTLYQINGVVEISSPNKENWKI